MEAASIERFYSVTALPFFAIFNRDKKKAGRGEF